VGAVPAFLVWPGGDALPEPLAGLVRTIVACAPDETPGGNCVLQRLCELMLFMILRDPKVLSRDSLGLLRAQRDPVLRRVFHAIHARPGRRWTLEMLARSAGVSRSVLAERFKRQAGIPAMRYLRQYRVQLGTRRLHEEGLSVGQVARALGYRSAAAFRRARLRCQ
jgi:AraC-like DNA-binding protein